MTSDERSDRTLTMNTNITRSYKDLVVWQKGIALAKLVYQLTKNFPSEERLATKTRCAPLTRHSSLVTRH
jgi:hypothetical protein